MMRILFVLLALLLPVSTEAASRIYTITSFEKIRIFGDADVRIVTGRPPSVRAEGDQRAIDTLKIDVQGSLLTIGVDHANWSNSVEGRGVGRSTVFVTVPTLKLLSGGGSGALSVDQVRGPDFTLDLAGSGSAEIGTVTVDRLFLSLGGSGAVRFAGKARDAAVSLDGSGRIDGTGFSAINAVASLRGAGSIEFAAVRTVKVEARGSGRIDITGNASCTVKNDGSAAIVCGKEEEPR